MVILQQVNIITFQKLKTKKNSRQHLVSKLAMDNTLLRDARHFQLSFRQRQFLPSAISRLAMVCANVL